MGVNTVRTLKYLRDEGYNTGIVERFIPHKKIRIDLFGFADIVALRYGDPILAVQSCGEDYAAHYRKIIAEKNARLWIISGGDVILIGWRKLKAKRGGRQTKWTPRIHFFEDQDFNQN